jgi:hypothetical protein
VPDGTCLFFTSEHGGDCDVHRMNAAIIEELRKQGH